jgi:hypothetical protein
VGGLKDVVRLALANEADEDGARGGRCSVTGGGGVVGFFASGEGEERQGGKAGGVKKTYGGFHM